MRQKNVSRNPIYHCKDCNAYRALKKKEADSDTALEASVQTIYPIPHHQTLHQSTSLLVNTRHPIECRHFSKS